MDDKIIEEIKQYLPALQDAMSKGIAYGGELFNRFVQFSFYEHIVYIGICLVLLLPIFWFKKVCKLSNSYSPYWLAYLLEVIPFVILFVNIVTLLKIIFVPELYLIEAVSNAAGACR